MRRKSGDRKQRAVIFGPVEGRERWERECLAYCDRRRYELVGLVVGDENWGDAWALMTSGQADLIVVATEVHLPPGRSPRVETVTGELPRVDDRRPRRTRVIRLDGEA